MGFLDLFKSRQEPPLELPNGSFTVTTGGAQGTGCKYDLNDKYRQIQPLQER